VTGIEATGQKKLMLFSGRAHPELAEAVAKELGVELAPTQARDFANGEIYVRFEESVRGSDAFVLQSHTAPINQWIMEQLIMVDALKRASAKNITVIMPFYGYARQDKKHRGREPISARLMADLFKQAGAHRLMAIDLHTDQIQGYFDGPVDHLWAMPLLIDYIKQNIDRDRLTIVSPDAGRVKVADKWCDKLSAPLAIVHKRRDPNIANQVSVHEIVGDIKGRVCVLVDDMIDTGGHHLRRLRGAVRARRRGGRHSRHARGLLRPGRGPAEELAGQPGHRHRHPADLRRARFDKLTVLSVAPIVAKAISEVFEDGSVTSMFEGADD
jgi:ribose-phosphate pyrophosphokinase